MSSRELKKQQNFFVLQRFLFACFVYNRFEIHFGCENNFLLHLFKSKKKKAVSKNLSVNIFVCKLMHH